MGHCRSRVEGKSKSSNNSHSQDYMDRVKEWDIEFSVWQTNLKGQFNKCKFPDIHCENRVPKKLKKGEKGKEIILGCYVEICPVKKIKAFWWQL